MSHDIYSDPSKKMSVFSRLKSVYRCVRVMHYLNVITQKILFRGHGGRDEATPGKQRHDWFYCVQNPSARCLPHHRNIMARTLVPGQAINRQ
jgi:hypothetical protein